MSSPSPFPRDPLLDDPLYKLGDAAEAAALDVALLRSWLDREPIIELGRFDQAPQGTGKPRLLTLRRIIAIAIAAELVELGIITSRAGRIATLFTDRELPAFDTKQSAKPLLVVYPGSELPMKLVPSDGASRHDQFTAAAFLAVDYAEILRKVRLRLTRRGWKHLPIG
jgi:hypothetical protein